MEQNRPTPPPIPPSPKSTHTKRFMVRLFLILCGFVVLFCLWLVAAHLWGPKSESGINKTIKLLQRDSIALQGDFRPKDDFYTLDQVRNSVDDIRALGDIFRIEGHTHLDSVRIFENPRLARLANYNKAKSDSILIEVLPLWQAKAQKAILYSMKNKEEYTTATPQVYYNMDEGTIYLYSPRYIEKKNVEKDALSFNTQLKALRFKKVRYAVSRHTPYVEYILHK